MPGNNIKISQLDLVGLSGHIVDEAAIGTYYPLTKTSWSEANPSGFLTIEDGSWQIHSGHLVSFSTGISGELSGRLNSTGTLLQTQVTNNASNISTNIQDIDNNAVNLAQTGDDLVLEIAATGDTLAANLVTTGETLSGNLKNTTDSLQTQVTDLVANLKSTGDLLDEEVNQISKLDKTFFGDKTFSNKIVVKDKINFSAIDLSLNADDSVSFDKSDGSVLTLGQSYTSEYGKCVLSATDAAGLPLFEVYEGDVIIIGRYSKNTVVVSGESVIVDLPSHTQETTGTLSRGTLFRSGDYVRTV
jgi:co-chaperonin GroES (HSP10)